MHPVLPVKVLFLFVGLSINAADSVDDAQFIRTKTLAACHKIESSYNAAHMDENAANSPAFRVRWTTECRTLVLSPRNNGE